MVGGQARGEELPRDERCGAHHQSPDKIATRMELPLLLASGLIYTGLASGSAIGPHGRSAPPAAPATSSARRTSDRMVRDSETPSLVFFAAVNSFDLAWLPFAVQGLVEVLQSQLRRETSSLRRSKAKTCVLRESYAATSLELLILRGSRRHTRRAW
jgi:hypothetical protein